MEILIAALLLALCAGVGYLHWRLRPVLGQLQETLRDAIVSEVHRQDERIRKRVEREVVQEPEEPRTVSAPALRPGDSWPGG